MKISKTLAVLSVLPLIVLNFIILNIFLDLINYPNDFVAFLGMLLIIVQIYSNYFLISKTKIKK